MLKTSLEDLVKTSIRNIGKNKSRTALTSLGIIIGVASVILLTSIGTGLTNYITSQFESLGSNLVYVMPGKMFSESGGFNQQSGGAMLVTKFSIKDITLLKREVKEAGVILPGVELGVTVKYLNREKDASIYASFYEYGKVSNSLPEEGNGRWFTKEEEDKRNAVIVLGYNVNKELFPNNTGLGKKVVIKGKNLKVVGIVSKKGGGGLAGGGFDDVVYLPLNIGFDLTGNQDIQSIMVQATNKDDVQLLKENIEKVLKKKYDEDAFSVLDQSQILSSINSIIGTLTIALSGIAAISLVVGGIGIMNIMLVTVTERTREIGLRKAVGGTPNTILIQFLIEAVFLSCIGGGFGILLGWLGTLAMASFFPAAVTFKSIATAFIVSVSVGIVFGVAPARKASKLSPIEALRYE